ncbi:hypothetical protein N7523_005403 [Penicillium sp. IBT 18751x]|nr:hypothetical protein N7523_005403 [Penicillium sp. IBT 18751x]
MSFIHLDPPDLDHGLRDSKHNDINEKATLTMLAAPGEPKVSDEGVGESDSASIAIVTGADVSTHLLSLRDDFDSTFTLRSILLASGLACFHAVMSQIYQFKQTSAGVSGAFIVLISYFAGKAWAKFLPRGDKYEVLFCDLPLRPVTVILATISIGLFGYGICGFLRPIAVWHVESVYWGNLATVKTLQGLHWQEVKDSKPMRYFWYAFAVMSLYQVLPAYIFPWLNSVSIPIGALVMHCCVFWGKEVREAFQSAKEGRFDDRHHEYMANHYKEAPWWWYLIVLVGSFFLGLIVVLKEEVTMSPLADLKLGEYLKIPPRIMFLTQIYGTMLGGFVSYAIMNSIVTRNKALLVDGNGNASWRGANIQAYNTNAASWALASYLYKIGAQYQMVPIGMAIGATAVIVHRLFVQFVPNVRNFKAAELNVPQFIRYAGFIPLNQNQTCLILSWMISGLFVQYYLRTYKPRLFKEYSYLVAAEFDGGSLMVLFILSFAVFGAGGISRPVPSWWGNNVKGNYDWCPAT